MSAAAEGVPTEWHGLDVTKHHVTRLALAWTVPLVPRGESLFAALLDDSGSFASVLAYTRRKVPHYRVEAAQMGAAEDGALLVTVQYQPDTEAALQVPREMQDRAQLLEPLRSLAATLPVLCHADFAFASTPGLRTTPSLPMRPAADDRNSPFDEIFGVRGVKEDTVGNRSPGYTFSLDCLPTGEIALALDFVLDASPAAQAPARALDTATAIARLLVMDTQE
jgi:hypothetical protein